MAGIGGIALGLPGGMPGWAMLRTRKPADFVAFARDPQLQRDLAYLREKLPAKGSAAEMLKDPRLQRMVLQAYGLDSQVGMTALMRKVLESNPQDRASFAARMTDPRYRELAAALNYGGIAVPAIPAFASEARVEVDGFFGGAEVTAFTGRFAGIALSDVDLSAATTREGLAATLQAAFRRADGGREDIGVRVFGLELVFSDAKGRGGAQGFAFDTTGGATAVLRDTVAGRPATAAQGGPKVGDAATLDAIAQRYMQSRFEAAVGAGSDTLRAAVYARRVLPGVTNWYSVLADQNLSRVVRGALGLPDGMAKVDVDRQVAMLKSRMDIRDFKDPAKLGRMLDRFVAMGTAKEGAAKMGVGAPGGLAAPTGLATLMQPLPPLR